MTTPDRHEFVPWAGTWGKVCCVGGNCNRPADHDVHQPAAVCVECGAAPGDACEEDETPCPRYPGVDQLAAGDADPCGCVEGYEWRVRYDAVCQKCPRRQPAAGDCGHAPSDPACIIGHSGECLTAAVAERDKWHATANMRMGMLTAARGRAEAAEADMVRYKLYNDELVAMKATPAAGYEFWYHRAIAAEAERDRWKRMWDDEGTKANQALRKLAALQEAAEKVAVHLGVLNATQGPRPTEEWLLILEACAQEGAAARAKLAAVEALCAERDRQWNRLGGLHVGVAEVRAALRAGVPAAGDGPNT